MGRSYPAWVLSVDNQPEREDMMEAFASKFNRFQDMLGDKLLPILLIWKGERAGAFIDNMVRHSCQAIADIQMAIGEQKIDLIVRDVNQHPILPPRQR